MNAQMLARVDKVLAIVGWIFVLIAFALAKLAPSTSDEVITAIWFSGIGLQIFSGILRFSAPRGTPVS
jgi:hypothetical protein